jgi:Domain of unknown function (DUF4349)
VVFAVLTMGSQTSRILSTVGAPVGGYEGAAAPEWPAPAPTEVPAAGGQAVTAAAPIPALLIVRTGTLDLEVTDLAQAIAVADSAVTRAGGYVSASTRTVTADDSTTRATYRIPSAAWDATLGALHGLAREVRAEEIKTEEVTGQVVDLTARISNLRATEAAVQSIMAKATKIKDVLDVQAQLTTTRGEIERLVAEKGSLEKQASFGSLAVTFGLPVQPKPPGHAEAGQGLGSRDGRRERDGEARQDRSAGHVGRDLAGDHRPSGRPRRCGPARPRLAGRPAGAVDARAAFRGDGFAALAKRARAD